MDLDSYQLFRQIRQWQDLGRDVALATVVRTWGSSPRPAGSHLAVDSIGEFVGSVSGGCVEATVIDEALGVIRDGRLRRLQFGISDEQAWGAGLACGGQVDVFLERIESGRDILERLIAVGPRRAALAVVTRLSDGRQALIDRELVCGDLPLSPEQLAAVSACVRIERSGQLLQDDNLFVRVYAGSPRLLVVGAVHVAMALAPMATLAGFEVTVIEPRSAFAHVERVPNVILSNETPGEALTRLRPDARTAVVTLTHDAELDDPALIAALRSDAFYVGALGNARTHALRVQRLTQQGLGDRVGRIHAPVGLALGARSPSEIAVAILAQLVQERYRDSRQ